LIAAISAACSIMKGRIALGLSVGSVSPPHYNPNTEITLGWIFLFMRVITLRSTAPRLDDG